MSTENKPTQYCGAAQEMGDSLLIELNVNQLRDILSNPENAKFMREFATKDGSKQQVIKLKAVKRKEVQNYSTHFLCLNDYVKGEKKESDQDLPF